MCWLKAILIYVCLIFSVGSTNSTEPVDSVKFLTQYSSVIMRNLESHINITEGYLEDNNEFIKYATNTLASLSKSMQTLRRNTGLGDVPTQDFKDTLNLLQKQIRDITSDQRRQKEATNLLSMKIDLILQTLISQKEIQTNTGSEKKNDDSKLDDIILQQKESSSQIKELKNNIVNTLDSKKKTIMQVSKEIEAYSSEAKIDRMDMKTTLRHIKDITDENFMILREEIKKKAECESSQPLPQIYHIPEPEPTPVPVEENVESQPEAGPAIPSDPKAPKIESATSFINIDLLKDFEARILVSGVPRPVITWSSGQTCNGEADTSITTGGRHIIEDSMMAPGLYAASLKIISFRHEDANLCYVITANNSEGTVSSNVVLAPKTHLQDCSGTYQKVDNLCLDLLTLWSPWEVSKAECEALGGQLIQHTDLEHLFAMFDTWPAIKTAEKKQKFWIGASKSHSEEWRLLNGTEIIVPYHLWAKGEPNESGKCLMVDIGEKEWRVWDAPCTSQRQAICQMS